MSATFQVVEDLEVSLRSRSSSERHRLLRAVTDLFLNGTAHHSDAQIELFDDILCRLVEYVERQALAELSAELAPIAFAPLRLVRSLARHDDLAVAGPLLRRSQRLQVDDLIEIASAGSQAHLAAIGGRAEIAEPVTDILVEKGDTEVARTIAANAGARFSPTGFSRLVTRAESEDGLAELVAIRSEISVDQLRQLIFKATEAVRRRLLAVAKPETRERIDEVLREIAWDIARSTSETGRDYLAAQLRVEGMRHDPQLMKAALADAARQDELEASVALLAALGELAISAVERVMTNDDTGGILLLCKALELEWPMVREILSLHRAGKTAGAAQLDRARKQFARINMSTARRVVRFWRVRTAASSSAGALQQTHAAAAHHEIADDWSNWTLQ
jgi:uncharacterized protein (DUF2336 family)